MRGGDVRALGRLLNESHKSLKELYEVTGIELDTLAEVAQSLPYCAGSRMTGGGFGGCAVSLVRKDCIEEFKQKVRTGYEKKIGYAPAFYNTDISDGITVTKLS